MRRIPLIPTLILGFLCAFVSLPTRVASDSYSGAVPTSQINKKEKASEAKRALTSKSENLNPFANPPEPKQKQHEQKQTIEKFVRSHERLYLNPVQVSERVRRTGRFAISTATKQFNLQLVPNDLLAIGYRAEESHGDRVVRPILRPSVRTFKGAVVGSPGTYARLTIAEDTIEGTISMSGERYYIEPAKRYSESASATDFVLYKSTDVIDSGEVKCGVTLDSKIKSAAGLSMPASDAVSEQSSQVFSPKGLVVLATEADSEFVARFGNSTDANNEILSIMNQVDGIYEAEIGINFRIAFQHTWATNSDPYNSFNATTALDEFRTYWNANFGNIQRDGAYLWTGRNLGVGGISYVRAICTNPANAYGLTNATIQSPYIVTTTAHELGHNLGATHADEIPSPDVACYKTIMWSYSDALISLPTFCQYSRDEIATFLNSNSCPLFNNLSGQIVDAKGNKISGVTVTLSGQQSATTQTDFAGKYSFGHLAVGANYVIAPNKSNYTFSPSNQTINSFSAGQVVNFTATPATSFDITGRLTGGGGAGIANVTMTLSGSQLNTTQSDSSGNYKFENVGAGGTYTVVPPRIGYSFSPSSRTFSNLSGNQTGVDFSGSQLLYPIEGRVWISGTTTPISGVTVTLTGDGSATTTTNSEGLFSLGMFPAFGNYTIFFSKPAYTFSPPRLNLLNITAAQNSTFFGFQVYTLTNSVFDDFLAPIPGVTVTLTGAQSAAVQTDSHGTFTFPNLPVTGPYTLTPSRPGYIFVPSSRSVTQLGILENNYFFRGTPLFTLRGRVATTSGVGIPEVSVNLIGTQTATTYSVETDVSGNYNFTRTPPPDSYTVIPAKIGYSLTPTNTTVNTVLAQQTANFTATAVATPSPTPTPSPIPFIAGVNGKIAFTSQRNGRPEIFVMNSNGTNQTRLTTVTFSSDLDWKPVWSPDGSKIAFERYQNDQYDIDVMNADGSNQKRLTTDVSWDRFPSWSPDGTKIAFASGRSSSQQQGKIYVMNADGSNPLRITATGSYDDVAPAWSPDGTKIAFISYRDGNPEIYVMNPDGSNLKRLTNNVAFDFAPSWSPDSSKIVFYSSRNGNNEIFVMNADGSNQTRLSSGTSDDTDPTWSRDGSKIAFITLRTTPAVVGGVVVMNSDGSNQTLVLSEFVNTGLSWQGVPAVPTPSIFIEDATTNRVVALDSVTLVRGPFRILTDNNFSADRHTRVILFTSPLGLTQPDPSQLTVSAGGVTLTIEGVGPVVGVSGLNASYVIVRLPDGLPTGDLPLIITLHGVASINSPSISISP